MAGALVVGVDVGTTNTKVGLYRLDGSCVALRRWPTPTDAARLVSEVLAEVRGLAERADHAPVAVGVAGMAESGVVVDADLTPLHPLIRWDDPRGGEDARMLGAELGRQELFNRTGVTLGAKTPLARWRWLTRTQPGLLSGDRVWLGAPDLVASVLTGAPVTDPTLAGRTGGYDIAAGRYHPDLLAAAGVTPQQVPPATGIGMVSPAMADRCGLAAGTPVVVAGHDHLVAAYAAGARAAGDTADSLGTAEAFITLTDRCPTGLTAGTGVSWNRFVDGSTYCLISGFPGAGRLVDWFITGYLGSKPDEEGYRRFTALVAEVTERPTGIVVEPYLSGRGAPAPDPNRRLRISGLAPHHVLAHLGVALLEGACMHLRWMSTAHQRVTGRAPIQTVVVGGPTRNEHWMRIKVAVNPAPSRLVDTPDTVCAGAAMLAARIGLGVPAATLPTRRLAIDPDEAARYDRFYHDRFLPAVTAD